MNCFSELIYSIYLDGELPEAESRQVKDHLETCLPCQHLVKALRVENSVLSEVLQGVDDEPARAVAQRVRLTAVLGKAVAVSAIGSILLSLLFSSAEQLLPSSADWLNPLHVPGQTNLLFTITFFLTNIGAAMMSQIVTIVSTLVEGVLVVSAGVLLWRYHKWFFRLGTGAVLLIVLVTPGNAFEKRASKATVTVGSNETVNDTLVMTGDTVLMDGVVNGDLIIFARRIEVHGTVKGDLMCFAQRTEISGPVGGNVYGFSQSLDLSGHVAGNIYGWIQSLHVRPESTVGGNIVAGAGDMIVDGKVTRSVVVYAGTADVRGTIGHDLEYSGGKLNLFDPARVEGNLVVHVRDPKTVHVSPGVNIGGKTEILREVRPSRFSQPRFYFWEVVKLLGALLIGWLILLLAPKFFHGTVQAVGSWQKSLGIGFIVLIVTPVVVIVACITLVGLPLGLILLGFYLIGFYFAVILVGAFLGRAILRSTAASTSDAVLALLVGMVILLIVFKIPYGVGILLHLAAYCMGFGAMAWQLYRAVRSQAS